MLGLFSTSLFCYLLMHILPSVTHCINELLKLILFCAKVLWIIFLNLWFEWIFLHAQLLSVHLTIHCFAEEPLFHPEVH